MENGDFPEDLAVRVRNVGKTYRLGVINRRTLRDELVYRWLRLRGRDPKESMGRVDGREMEDPGLFHALDDVSFDVRKGETIGIVGESGCGKTTLLKAIMNMQLPTSGRIIFRGEDITQLTGEAKRQNYRHIQMVFQDPTAAFDPSNPNDPKDAVITFDPSVEGWEPVDAEAIIQL